MDNKKFIVNGKEYASIEDVPEEFRGLVKAAQEKAGQAGAPVQFSVQKKFKFKVNGQEYDSVEEMPEAARRLFTDRNGNGVPDILEDIPQVGHPAPIIRRSAARVQPNVPVLIKEGSSSRVFLVVAVFAAAALLGYFLFMK
jgi:hypothetical protein